LKSISKERAERIAKGHACENCGEYTYKRVSVKPATKRLEESLGIVWSAHKTCGVCNAEMEMGINPEGDIVFVS
jgi:transcription elongation factor Elf1